MKTWPQLTAIARRRGLLLVHAKHSAVLRTDDETLSEAGRCEWWHGSKRECDEVVRAMVEAVLR